MKYPNVSTQIARHLVNGATTNGGATVNHLLQVPRAGFCVGLGGAKALDPKRGYMEQALDIVDASLGDFPKCAFGAWVDVNDGHALYIEPVEIFSNEADAVDAAVERGELAIYDLGEGVEIRVREKLYL